MLLVGNPGAVSRVVRPTGISIRTTGPIVVTDFRHRCRGAVAGPIRLLYQFLLLQLGLLSGQFVYAQQQLHALGILLLL